MKRIAVFCDGTWNSPTMLQHTHVRQLYLATQKSGDQVAAYFKGVGTGGTVNTLLTNTLNRIGGGAFGWGLNGKIKQAYRYLAEHYAPGDEILIFGFSRGAYTARSLAGMIRKCGFPDRPDVWAINSAFRLYKRAGPENAPDTDHIWAERRRLSPRFATSQKDLERRADDSHLVRISYLGIWDTVGALGIPEPIFGPLARLWNNRYRFHDTDLSSLVLSARHAVALDERRAFYEVTPWSNLDASAQGPGLNKGDTSPDRPYQQLWFVGDHGMVGGSGITRGLAAITLQWIAAGAQRAGMTLNPDIALLDTAPDSLDPGAVMHEPKVIYELASDLLRWRGGPTKDADLSPSARRRFEALPDYRPESLRRLLRDRF